MQIVDGKICQECGGKPSAVLCDGCGKILCMDCRIFDIWCYGCGHGDSKAFCEKCFDDPAVNVWRAPLPAP